ncbi:MAG: hypothetical protein JJT75_06440 [Opitutales bacterium]|nr:hypothetical protein [Opitutales bacterium]MCH8541112.1 hypothetical protein [Opitutales bacterium]
MAGTKLTPEEQAAQEIGRTELLGAKTARWLTLLFLTSIGVVLPLQLVYESAGGKSLQILDLFEAAPSAEHFSSFEAAHEDASFLQAFVQPRLQVAFSRFGGFGNTKTVVGGQGWLYYEPGVSHLTGFPPFDPDLLERRKMLGARNPDPRIAIEAMAKNLAEHGIELILLPVPDKASVHPEFLTKRRRDPLPDPAIGELKTWAEEREIRVLDIFPVFASEREEQGRAFLAQDTHWTPSAMERVAKKVAAEISVNGTAPVAWQKSEKTATRVGDLVDMLQLPEGQTLFPPETVSLQQILDEEGQPWRSIRRSPVLLLGDSFTNIFHLEEMEWGTSSGFGAHLAYQLGSAIDQIAINGGGSDAVRIELSRRNNPLQGLQTVVWQFSARDLSHGSWPVVTYAAPRDEEEEEEDEDTEDLIVTGRLTNVPPTPSVSAPYANARGAFLLEVEEAEGPRAPEIGSEILIQAALMENRQLQPAARWRENEQVTLTLKRGVPEEWSGRELLDETFVFDDRTLYWVISD